MAVEPSLPGNSSWDALMSYEYGTSKLIFYEQCNSFVIELYNVELKKKYIYVILIVKTYVSFDFLLVIIFVVICRF